jgi:hypothetical protein
MQRFGFMWMLLLRIWCLRECRATRRRGEHGSSSGRLSARRKPIFRIRTQEGAIDQTLMTERLIARLAAVFGGLAIVLASIGLYGLLAYEVARRTRELGIRAALGAQKWDVVGMVVWQGFALTFVRTIAGEGVAAALTRYFGVAAL